MGEAIEVGFQAFVSDGVRSGARLGMRMMRKSRDTLHILCVDVTAA